MTRGYFLRLLCVLIFANATCTFSQEKTLSVEKISGFTPSSAAREMKVETTFKAIPSPEEERRQHRIFTAEPHVAGSKRNKRTGGIHRFRVAQTGPGRRDRPPL
jgi:hypothetical protein